MPDPLTGNKEQDDNNYSMQEISLMGALLENNYMQVVFWYWFIDGHTIFPTSFDFMIFYGVFYTQSLILATHVVTSKFIATTLDS